MTLPVFENRNIKARPDLPAYSLNTVCARPGCNRRDGLQVHHLERRSHVIDGSAWWIELDDGSIVPNKWCFCEDCHAELTGGLGGHTARLVWDRTYYWENDKYWASGLSSAALYGGALYAMATGELLRAPLSPQPPVYGGFGFGESPEVSGLRSFPPRVVTLSEGGKQAWEQDRGGTPSVGAAPPSESVPEGSTCPTCSRRVPHKHKESSPKSTTRAMRLPNDAAEDFDEIEQAVFEHLGMVDDGGKLEPFARYRATLSGYIRLLQGEPEGRVA